MRQKEEVEAGVTEQEEEEIGMETETGENCRDDSRAHRYKR